jgi:hypothetical protein
MSLQVMEAASYATLTDFSRRTDKTLSIQFYFQTTNSMFKEYENSHQHRMYTQEELHSAADI